jgi:hypothetical protein
MNLVAWEDSLAVPGVSMFDSLVCFLQIGISDKEAEDRPLLPSAPIVIQ